MFQAWKADNEWKWKGDEDVANKSAAPLAGGVARSAHEMAVGIVTRRAFFGESAAIGRRLFLLRIDSPLGFLDVAAGQSPASNHRLAPWRALFETY